MATNGHSLNMAALWGTECLIQMRSAEYMAVSFPRFDALSNGSFDNLTAEKTVIIMKQRLYSVDSAILC